VGGGNAARYADVSMTKGAGGAVGSEDLSTAVSIPDAKQGQFER